MQAYYSHTMILSSSVWDAEETEYTREWCTKKEEAALCFLFARKFTEVEALLYF
ncbi:hypothetical protein DsansV1_C09g0094111 [Dioscorea sansibarensis]